MNAAETPGERHLLGGADRLIAKEDDKMVQEGLADFAESSLAGRIRQIDAVDLGAKCAGERANGDMAIVAHGFGTRGRWKLGSNLPEAAHRRQFIRTSGASSGTLDRPRPRRHNRVGGRV